MITSRIKKSALMIALISLVYFLIYPIDAHAMHIMEGMLPPKDCLIWYLLALPFFIYGLYRMKKIVSDSDKNAKIMLALSGALIFVLSSLKMPSVTGSSSHPTGVGLGTVMFGPGVIAVLGVIVLLFQALLLAHGGLTTLGANTFSMTIAGPIAGFITWKLCRKFGVSRTVSVFMCAMIADLMTYVTTAIQLAIVFPDPSSGIAGAAVKFLGIFAVTQIPLAIAEGMLTVIVYNLVISNDLWKESALQ